MCDTGGGSNGSLMGKKNVLGDALWWEETGGNRETIKGRERPDGDSTKPKKNSKICHKLQSYQ